MLVAGRISESCGLRYLGLHVPVLHWFRQDKLTTWEHSDTAKWQYIDYWTPFTYGDWLAQFLEHWTLSLCHFNLKVQGSILDRRPICKYFLSDFDYVFSFKIWATICGRLTCLFFM